MPTEGQNSIEDQLPTGDQMTNDNEADQVWMEGFPPTPDRRIRFGDGSFAQWPQLRWSLAHMDELVPTRSVWRGSGAAWPFEHDAVSLESLLIETANGPLDWQEAIASTYTDGLLVLRGGRIAHEWYRTNDGQNLRHSTMSCNKSIVGTIAESLIEEGNLDEQALVPTVVPELGSSAWADATIRNVLDMRVGIAYDEDYANPKSDVWTFLRCTAMMPPEPGTESLSIAEVLPTFAKSGQHGAQFAYQEPNIFVLGWIVRRAANASLARLMSERIWQHIGAGHDAYYMLDPAGAETTNAMTLRDFARFGQLIIDGGCIDGHQVLSPTVIDNIFAGGDREAFAAAGLTTMPGWSYRSQWWIRHTGDTTVAVARGAYGQMLYIDPSNDVVIARFGSAQQPSSTLLDPILLPTIDAIVACLAQ